MSVPPDLWGRARPLFEAALELPVAERGVFLDRKCGGDVELRSAVERLLRAAEDDSPFLDDGLGESAVGLLADTGSADAAGRRVGPYRLLRLLGAGGMGAVYLAERDDGEFEQRVAIKRIRSGPVAPDEVSRFRRERQILAWLDHPNIARLLDGGVTEAGPYLAMEYVEGEPIDRYCDARGLDLEARVEVFLAVCDAVEYAHRNLVVHRDLKPGNILVTAAGEVKLLDFGIARLLDAERDQGPLTGAGVPLLTPEYASPEQLRGGPLGTTTDVYALGAVLYELLTGRVPHELRGLSAAAMERAVCERPPRRPSELRRELRGDLDTILLQALHVDASRRYGSAAALAEDLRRHLARRPVSARPDTVAYRLSRFVGRHRAGVAASAVIVLALVGGAAATAYQGLRAQRRAESVRSLANALLFDLHDAVRDLPGATPARQLLVSHALTYLDRLQAEVPDDPGLQLELAAAYERVGRVQGDPHRTNLGDLEGALSSYTRALALREAVFERTPETAGVRHALGASYGRLAVVTSWSGRNGEAIDLSRRAIGMLEPLRTDPAIAAAVGRDLGRIEAELGWWLIWAGRIEEGLGHIATGIGLLETLVDPDDADPDPAFDLWRAYSYRFDGLRFSDRHAAALALLRDTALPHLRAMAERYPMQPDVQYGLHVCHDYIGTMHVTLEEPEAAIASFHEALRIAEALVVADAANHKAHEALARSHESLAIAQVRIGRLEEGIASFERGIEVFADLAARNPRNVEIANMLGNAQRQLCRVLEEGSRPEPALPWCLAGERTLLAVVAANDDNIVVRANLGSAYVLSARVYRALAAGAADASEAAGHTAAARGRYEDALRLLRELSAGTDASPEFEPDAVAAELEDLVSGR